MVAWTSSTDFWPYRTKLNRAPKSHWYLWWTIKYRYIECCMCDWFPTIPRCLDSCFTTCNHQIIKSMGWSNESTLWLLKKYFTQI